MRAKPDDESVLIRYLLGQLAEAEAARVEETLLADDDFFHRLTAVEQDLIDSYLRAQLPQAQHRLFAQAYLSCPSRRSKVEFAQALMNLRGQTEPAGSFLRKLLAAVLGNNPQVLRFALAAAMLLLCAGSAWLGIENFRLRRQLAVLEADQQGRAIQPADSRQAIVSFLLLPGVERGAREMPRLLVPSYARQVRLHLGDVPLRDYSRFHVTLRTVDGYVAWSGEVPGASPTLDLPASILQADDYLILLVGLTKNGQPENLGSYQFGVARR